jgi:hypothetical protein
MEKSIKKKDINTIFWLIPGYRRFSNVIWFSLLIIAGAGFLLRGIASYFNLSFQPFFSAFEINYIPQGIIMTFYGTLAIILGFFIFFGFFIDVGGGSNEFNKKNNLIRIIRNGWPGKNRSILLTYAISEIEKIEVFIREGLNPQRIIYLVTKDGRKLPLTPIGQPMTLSEIEDKAFRITRFLRITLVFDIKYNTQ